ncbi:glycosyltransferase family 4 protein [Pseudooceanicola marinus]|uniref:glycosyltransferase family 4 protein n=1 Tax=Pseudooceanicola marinus TaxID=396013 RepID=UPI001CD2F3A8|nr:glycosyltransferase [Pseudooceanicola marinus]MCA1338160.1 glycosyltransferase [Pseudooceanicola marinus]
MSAPIRLRLIHETNPAKYFPALYDLAREGRVQLTGAHRYSVVKEWLRAWRRDRTPPGVRTANAWHDLLFRLSLPGVRGEVVVMGFAPWDWRLLIYRGLARRNRILYHTSWHDWGLERTPRQPRPAALKRWLQGRWLAFLRHPNVTTVAVTPVVAEAVRAAAGVEARVIPHAVPAVFFEAGARHAPRQAPGLRLLYVGEISEKKGIGTLLEMMPQLAGQGIRLTVVGNGPLAGAVEAAAADPAAGLTFLGPVMDRAKLAGIMAEHDILMLLSRKTETWEELFGIVVVEALAAGLAVIASDHVGPRGILHPAGGAGLFPQDDTAAIASELAALATDPARLSALRQRQAPVARAYGIAEVAADWDDTVRAAWKGMDV